MYNSNSSLEKYFLCYLYFTQICFYDHNNNDDITLIQNIITIDVFFILQLRKAFFDIQVSHKYVFLCDNT